MRMRLGLGRQIGTRRGQKTRLPIYFNVTAQLIRYSRVILSGTHYSSIISPTLDPWTPTCRNLRLVHNITANKVACTDPL